MTHHDVSSPVAGGSKAWLIFSRYFDELEALMEFRLTYEGPLHASSNSISHPAHKHEIRKNFHTQLRRYWEINPILKHWKDVPVPPIGGTNLLQEPNKTRLEQLADNFARGKFRFAPLAIADRQAIVTLDILFLRSGIPGMVTSAGDIDGRIKTLIDALRMPKQASETGQKYQLPDEGEDPFFCLMEDDSLVGNLSVVSDTLLQPTEGSSGYFDTYDARVVIAVSLRQFPSGNYGTISWY
jgi:hypothetical protein